MARFDIKHRALDRKRGQRSAAAQAGYWEQRSGAGAPVVENYFQSLRDAGAGQQKGQTVLAHQLTRQTAQDIAAQDRYTKEFDWRKSQADRQYGLQERGLTDVMSRFEKGMAQRKREHFLDYKMRKEKHKFTMDRAPKEAAQRDTLFENRIATLKHELEQSRTKAKREGKIYERDRKQWNLDKKKRELARKRAEEELESGELTVRTDPSGASTLTTAPTAKGKAAKYVPPTQPEVSAAFNTAKQAGYDMSRLNEEEKQAYTGHYVTAKKKGLTDEEASMQAAKATGAVDLRDPDSIMNKMEELQKKIDETERYHMQGLVKGSGVLPDTKEQNQWQKDIRRYKSHLPKATKLQAEKQFRAGVETRIKALPEYGKQPMAELLKLQRDNKITDDTEAGREWNKSLAILEKSLQNPDKEMEGLSPKKRKELVAFTREQLEKELTAAKKAQDKWDRKQKKLHPKKKQQNVLNPDEPTKAFAGGWLWEQDPMPPPVRRQRNVLDPKGRTPAIWGKEQD